MAALQWLEFVLLILDKSHNSLKNLVMISSKVCFNLTIMFPQNSIALSFVIKNSNWFEIFKFGKLLFLALVEQFSSKHFFKIYKTYFIDLNTFTLRLKKFLSNTYLISSLLFTITACFLKALSKKKFNIIFLLA